MYKKVALLLLLTMPWIPSAQALLLTGGTQELIVEGMIDTDSVLGTQIDLHLGYGYFIYDYIEIGGSVGLEDNDALTSYSFTGFFEYNFDTLTDIIPIAGARIGYTNLDADSAGESTGGIEFGVYGGAKVFLTDYLALSGTLNLSLGSDDIFADEDGTDDFQFDLRFGLRTFF